MISINTPTATSIAPSHDVRSSSLVFSQLIGLNTIISPLLTANIIYPWRWGGNRTLLEHSASSACPGFNETA